MNIFRAYDVRGIFGKDLTVEIMTNIGRAFGTYMRKHDHRKVTIGGDIRASTNILLHALLAGVTSTGVSCDVIETSPLGITLFNSFAKEYGASAFITASHLPPEWNGVKFYWGPGIGFSPDENTEVKDIFVNRDFIQEDAFNIGTFNILKDPYTPFMEYLKKNFYFNRKFKIAVDCGNGATALVQPQLYEDLGLEVIPLFEEPDSRFPNRSSEPTEKSLTKLSELIKNNNVDFGVGFDGDGDRAVFVDELGNVVSSDATGVIIAEYLMKSQNNNKVLINMECSVAMENYLKSIGADVYRIRVGHSFLSLEAKKQNAVWGVESSGHAIAPHIFLFDDALVLPLLLVKALESNNKPLSELVKNIPLPIKQRYDLKCPDDVKFKILDKIINDLKSEPGEKNNLDGFALSQGDKRILVRVSNTSPKIRVTIEGMNENAFNEMKDKYLQRIMSFIEN